MNSDSTNWILAFASVVGKGHVENNTPCQDFCDVRLLQRGWGIAVVADGAGSAVHSKIGSAKTVDFAIEVFSQLIEQHNWINSQKLPSPETWQQLSYQFLHKTHLKLQSFATQNEYLLSDLATTIIVLIFSPQGLMMAHIGDGRAAYSDTNGVWHSMMIPFSGELANETVFITSPFWDLENSHDFVESQVITSPIQSFCLLSDGSEKACFEVNLYDADTQKYYDPNLPYHKFFQPCKKALLRLHQEGKSQAEINQVWANFLQSGNRVLKNERDDKTLVMGVRASND